MLDVSGRAAKVSAGTSFAASLEFQNVSHRFSKGEPILHDVSLKAEPRQVLCLLGPSGSGKTTLLRIAAGIEVQSQGRVLMNDREIAGPATFMPPEQRSVGLMFQDFSLFPHMTILDNVRFGLTALSREEGKREAMISLERVGLAHYAGAYPHVLSGGEQQRVALARATAPRPGVLLMDEPFSGLDSRLKDNVRSETLAVLRQSHVTAIIVTHDAEEAMRMSDRIALLKNGRVVQTGTPQELYRDPASIFAASFFSELNVLDGVVRNRSVDTPLGRFDAGKIDDGTKTSVAIRLTAFEVSESDGSIPVRIVSRRFLGDVELLEFIVPGFDQRLRARIRCGALSGGSVDIALTIRRSDVLVFARGSENT